MNYFDWKIEMPDVLKAYIDRENKRIAILTAEDDEIHMALEFDENNTKVEQKLDRIIELLEQDRSNK